LGGRLSSRILCKKCNDYLGRRVEAQAKKDASIRLAIETLRGQIPKLASELSEGQEFIAQSKGGTTRGVIRGGDFRVRSSKEKDDSLIQPTPSARKTVEKLFLKSGRDVDVQEALHKFDNAPEDIPIQLTDGIVVIKWRINTIAPVLDAKTIDDFLPLKIAFEYIALNVGSAVYSPKLDPFRDALLNPSCSTSSYKVEYLRSPKVLPFHGLIVEKNDPHAIVQVRLFGWLAYRIHFLQISIGEPRIVYTHDLRQRTEHLARA